MTFCIWLLGVAAGLLAVLQSGAANTTKYTIQPGDTLSAIGQAHNVTSEALLAANPNITNPDLIYPGEVISVPEAASTTEYTVKSGDTLSAISSAHNNSLSALLPANPHITDPNLIVPGKAIEMPGNASSMGPSPGAAGPPAATPDVLPLAMASPAMQSPSPATSPQSPFGAPAPQPSTSGFEYIIEPGDTLFQISQTYHVSLARILAANPQITNPNFILAGQTIRIPLASISSPPALQLRWNTPPTLSAPPRSSSNTGNIVRAVAGGVAALAIIAAVLWLWLRHSGLGCWKRMRYTHPGHRTSSDIPNDLITKVAEKQTRMQISLAPQWKRTQWPPTSPFAGLLRVDGSEATGSTAGTCSTVADISAPDDQIRSLQSQLPRPSAIGTMPCSQGILSIREEPDARLAANTEQELEGSWKIDACHIQIVMHSGQPARLGSGGCGLVFLGVLFGAKRVAIKSVHSHTLKQQARFVREINVLRSCHDPNIVQFLGASVRGQQTLLIMQYMPGGDLFKQIAQDSEGQLNWYQRGRGIALNVAKGLNYLHSRRILHLNIKSPNILLTQAYEAKIADVGLGKIVAGPEQWLPKVRPSCGQLLSS